MLCQSSKCCRSFLNLTNHWNFHANYNLREFKLIFEQMLGIRFIDSRLLAIISTVASLVGKRKTRTNDVNISRVLFRDTSLNTMAEVRSRYHFAAHMGQLISGVEGQGCHNFYPTCPLPGSSVLNMMKKIRLR